MRLGPGQLLTLTIEKPAVGGSMIARHDGQVVLVSGAIPGERVTARIDKVGKGVVYAQTVSVDEASPDRREPFTDSACGGCLYAHIDYLRQLEIKALVIADAFGRIGHVPLKTPVAVAHAQTDGYRMRARVHVRDGRAGFFREGTHELCDARATRQLLPSTCDVIDHLAAGLRSLGLQGAGELEVSENVDASDRAVHIDAASPIDPRSLAALARTDGITGLSLRLARESGELGPAQIVGGVPYVTDAFSIEGHIITVRRHVLAFFQGNRFLLHDLAAHVVSQIAPDGDVVDLYAGTGVFAVAASVVRGVRVIAVEGDRMAAQDLEANAAAVNAAVEPVCLSVEAFAARSVARPGTVIVDPPRTGLSKEAMQGVVRLGARRLVYVSCDVATLARDARRLLDAGYVIDHIAAFDLFPNTPHVETVVTFSA